MTQLSIRTKAYLALAIFYVIIGFWVGVIIADFHIPIINPVQKTQLSFEVNYPPVTGSDMPLLLRATMYLEADSIISENTRIFANRSSGGYIYPNNESKIGEVYFGFSSALPHKLSSGKSGINYSVPTGVWLINWDGQNLTSREALSEESYTDFNFTEDFIEYQRAQFRKENEFYFPVAGDYSPTILIWFYNDTTIQYTYNDIKVHVASATEVQSQKLDRINTAITITLFALALVEGISVVNDLTKRKEKN